MSEIHNYLDGNAAYAVKVDPVTAVRLISEGQPVLESDCSLWVWLILKS